MRAIDIIGGGIGGLSLAIALKQKGFAVRVFEQAAELREVGAGINLACNAMQVYDKLGLRASLESVGHICHRMQVTDQNLHSLSDIDIRPFEKRFKVHNVAIHRAALQQVLREQLTEEEILLGKQLVKMEDLEDITQLHFSDGTQYDSQYVIGADGIDSAVRQQWFEQGEVRYTDQVCWRGISELVLPAPYYDQLTEAWGPQGRFGFVQVDTQRAYWFAVMRNTSTNETLTKATLVEAFQQFHPLVVQLLAGTPASLIHEAPLGDLRSPPQWHRGRVCLIGDAAHATTPNLGQGACQAIEDAWVLAHFLEQTIDVEQAFEHFQSTRQSKVRKIVKTSWMVGQMAHWQNPLAIQFRNALMRMMPAWAGEKQSERIYELESLQ